MRFSLRSRGASWFIIAAAAAVLAAVTVQGASGQSTAFTYQGELKDGDAGINAAEARFVFRVWTAQTGGSQIGSDWVAYPVPIVDGIFTALVDFGTTPFNGLVRWLEIGVDPAGGTSYTWMAPRQQVTAAPLAIYAQHGGDNPWRLSGDIIYYNTGNVGVGTSSPTSRFHVTDTGPAPTLLSVSDAQAASGTAVHGRLDAGAGYGVHGEATATASGEIAGVYGDATARYGYGVKGENHASNGTPVGVGGVVSAASGYGLSGVNNATTGDAAGVYGRSYSATGFGGYFLGRGYFSGRVGIGTASPTTELDVAGTVKMNGFRLGTSATGGYVLTTDTSGNGTWQPATGGGGYWLPGSSSTIYYDSGNVGIGIDAPTHALHVQADATVAAVFGQNASDIGRGVEGKVTSTIGTAAGVYGQAASPSGKGVHGHNTDTTGSGSGVMGTAAGSAATGIFGANFATSGSAVGVLGRSDSPTGFGGYFQGRGYFSGNVGIGQTNPSCALDVNGTVKSTGFQLGTAPQAGYVLTSDASGLGTWQPAAGGGGYWLPGSGSAIYYTGGNVGVGTGSPTHSLHVQSDATGSAVYSENSSDTGIAIQGVASSTSGAVAGVYGSSASPLGQGVKGHNSDTGGSGSGVMGTASGGTAIGVFGINTASSGSAYGVMGRSDSPTGFGGYFQGRGYFSGNVGIGRTNPTAALDVNGTVKSTGFLLETGPQAGYVLTADASGNGTWQPSAGGGGYWEPGQVGIHYDDVVGIGTDNPQAPLDVNGICRVGGLRMTNGAQPGYVMTSDANGIGNWQPLDPFTLPYAGQMQYDGNLFSMTNSGANASTTAIHAVINNTGGSGDKSAGYFQALGVGYAIRAESASGGTIRASHSGTVGAAIQGSSTGDYGVQGSCSKNGGVGVKGVASSTGNSSSTRGGWFESAGSLGAGVYAKSTGLAAYGVYGEATGDDGAGGYFSASGATGVGLIAHGPERAAKFYGNVDIYEYGTQNKVIELGKGLDYAEGFDLSEGEGSVEPGAVLVIDPRNPGRLTACRAAYDRKVAGIVAGANSLGSGVRLGAGQFDRDVALAGRVYCNVIAIGGDIEPGDLLTTSDVPSYAMKVRDHSKAQGAVLGKAMEPMTKGQKGQILVLVTLQ